MNNSKLKLFKNENLETMKKEERIRGALIFRKILKTERSKMGKEDFEWAGRNKWNFWRIRSSKEEVSSNN